MMDYKKRNASSYSKDYRYLEGDKSKTCPSCGYRINPFFVICPFCDFDFRKLSSYEICENCGRIIDSDDDVCDACGYILRPHESLPEVMDLCDEGFALIKDFKIKEAKVCFNKALKLDSMDVNPIIGNAYCLYYLGYYVLALKECDEALKLDADCVDEDFYEDVVNKANSVKG